LYLEPFLARYANDRRPFEVLAAGGFKCRRCQKKSTDVQWNEIDELREQQLFAAVQFGVAIQNNPVGSPMVI
jgi:hypothetical protein